MTVITPEWVKDAVFYQVFPDRFARSGRVEAPGPFEGWETLPTPHGFKGGDLYGIAERLDYLADLGITAIYLNPIFSSASNHRYHTYDYLAVDPLLGGDAALRHLLDEAHARGMRVILDGVFNHASRGFWAFNHILECGLGSPYLDWFHVDRDGLAAGRSLRAYPDQTVAQSIHEGNDAASNPGTETSFALGYKAWWGLPALPKFNTDNPAAREYLLRVAEHWISFGADGWRLDVAAEIDDDAFWREFRRRVKAINPDAYIVAEIWHEDHRWLQGDQFDAYMNYPLAEAALSFAGGASLDHRVIAQHDELAHSIRPEDGATFVGRLAHCLDTYDPAINDVQLNLLGSHDTPRVLTMLGGDANALRLVTLVQMTVAGAPCIYYGDEIGMTGEQDPFCRASFPWGSPETWDIALRDFIAGAIAFRHANPALRRGEFAIAGAEVTAAAWTRIDATDAFVIALNPGEEPAELPCALPGLDGRTLVAESWAGWPWALLPPVTVRAGATTIHLPARTGAILRAR